MDTLTPEQEATSVSTTPERLQELANHSDDKNVLKAIAANPNTPPEVLLKLGEHFPQEMLDNPVFKLLLLENPLDLVVAMPVKTIISLLQLKEIPSFLRQGISKHQERVQIASNPITPVSILEILAQDADPDVRSGVARNSNTPASVLEILAQDAEIIVRFSVALNTNTPDLVLEILAQDAEMMSFFMVAENLNAPDSAPADLANMIMDISVGE